MHRASQYKDVLRAVTRRKLRRHRVPRASFEKAAAEQDHFFTYRAVPQPPKADDDAEPAEKSHHVEDSQAPRRRRRPRASAPTRSRPASAPAGRGRRPPG